MTRVALLSVHTCPLAALGGKEAGGMNVYVREIARALGALGFAVDVFTRSQDPAIPEVVPLGDNARVIHVVAGPRAPIGRAAIAPHLPAFADAVERFRQAGRLEYAILHSHYWLSGLVALGLRARFGVPVVHMFHTLGAIKNAVARGSGDVEPADRLRAETRIAAEADSLVASNAVEREDLAAHLGADPARVRIIPCGVDVELFRPRDARAARARLGLEGDCVLLFVGRLTPIKGLETLLRALACGRVDGPRRAGLRLVVVGGDKDDVPAAPARRDHRPAGAGHLGRLARTLGVDGLVEFRGPQPQDALPDYYAAADLVLMPSRYESFGMVALEAMACGTPVIASRAGGLATTVQDGVTGVLVPEGDSCALAEAVAGLLGDDGGRRGLGQAAVERARQLAWPGVARAVAELYQDLRPGLALPPG